MNWKGVQDKSRENGKMQSGIQSMLPLMNSLKEYRNVGTYHINTTNILLKERTDFKKCRYRSFL